MRFMTMAGLVMSMSLLAAAVAPLASQVLAGHADSLLAVTPPHRTFQLTSIFKGFRGCKRDRDAARDGSIIFERNGARSAVKRLSAALTGDHIVVDSAALLRLQVEPVRFSSGSLYFTPKLDRCPPLGASGGGAVRAGDRVVLGVDLPDSVPGSYVISRDSSAARDSDRLVLVVRHGVAVIRRPGYARKNSLRVFALGKEITDINTTFAVVVDSTTGRASAHVLEGAIAMANGTVTATRGRSITFDAGAATRPSVVETPSDIAADIRFVSDGAWNTPSRLM